MTNKEIYQKTIGFSWRRLLYDALAFVVMGVLGTLGYVLMDRLSGHGLAGLGIGLVIGIVAVIIGLRYVGYTFKAGQIAMMTKAVVDNQLPDDVIGEGKKIVERRFATVAVYFTITGVIKGIFNQLGRGIQSIGKSIGGDTGDTVGSIISTGLQVMVGYLCDCCLGWVFFRQEVSAPKATCEGAVLFFKHGKTLMKNMGRIFGLGILSFLVIGGAFMGVFYAIFSRFPAMFTELAVSIQKLDWETDSFIKKIVTDPNGIILFCALVAAAILWSILHGAFVRPYVLVGVLRNYIASGINDIPTESSFAALDAKSAKFKKLHAELN